MNDSFGTRAALALTALLLTVNAPAFAVQTQSGSPIEVSNCNPTEGQTFYAGYTPAYYPYYGRPWGWPSVYGYGYAQYPYTTTNPSLAIDYKNVTSEPVASVEFGLVANGRLVAEVKDVGTFSQGAEIKHTFGLNPNVFPLSTGLPRCVPLQVTYKNGQKWRNPHLPAIQRSVYQP